MLKIFVLLILFFLAISVARVYGNEINSSIVNKLAPYLALPIIKLDNSGQR